MHLPAFPPSDGPSAEKVRPMGKMQKTRPDPIALPIFCSTEPVTSVRIGNDYCNSDMITKPLHTLDHIRKSFNDSTNRTGRAQIGQFLTPSAIARFMSSMCETFPQEVRILDPGAGAGVLFAALVDTLISRKNRPLSIEVVAYETDSAILPFLKETVKRCEALCTSKRDQIFEE